MTQYPVALDRNERHGQTSGLAQILHDLGFVAPAMLGFRKRGSYNCRDCIPIRSNLGPYCHFA